MHLIVIYERGQIDEVLRCLARSGTETKVIALNYWVERELSRLGVPVLSLADYCPPWGNYNDLLAVTDYLSRHWWRMPQMAFFEHKDLSLGEMFEAVFGMHFQEVRAYLHVFECIFTKHQNLTQLTIPHTTQRVSATSGPFTSFQVQTVVRVGEWYAKYKGVAFEAIGVSQIAAPSLFPPQPFWRWRLLKAYNFFISSISPRRPVRIYVSDHWRNIKSVIEKMDDAELVFVDRKELRHIPYRALWKHRIRFLHPLDSVTKEMRQIAALKQEEFRIKWQQAKKTVENLPGFVYKNSSWWSIVEPLFTTTIEVYAERVVADIEAIKAVIVDEQINRTLLRASISGQHHFFILGELPHLLGIPSIEIQHGIGVGILDPNSAHGHLHADYVAAYGPLVRRAFVRSGYQAERVQLTGSPRFDRYKTERDALTSSARDAKVTELGLDPKRPIIFVVMLEENAWLALGASAISSYEYRDFISALQGVCAALPTVQLILKFRSQGHKEMYEEYVREMLPQERIAMEYGDAFSLLLLSDLAYSCFSTMVCECIMGRKPVVLFPLKSGDTYFYEAHKEGVVQVPLLDVHTLPVKEVVDVTRRLIDDKAQYADAVREGERYLVENFTFTGDASLRVANFLRVAQVPKDRN